MWDVPFLVSIFHKLMFTSPLNFFGTAEIAFVEVKVYAVSRHGNFKEHSCCV